MSISMQKRNFSTHFFLEILQQYYMLYLLSALGMLDHTHQIWYYQHVENIDAYLYKGLASFLASFLRYYKELQICYFGYFQHDWPCSPKLIPSTCRKVWSLSQCKKLTPFVRPFQRYYTLQKPGIW